MQSSETAMLVASAKYGNRAALESLFARHRGRLVALLQTRMIHLAGTRVAPDDLAQETLLEASRKLAAFESQGPASFYRWLVGIARFKLAEAARAARAEKRAHETPLEEAPPADQTSPSGVVLRNERATLLRAALAALPETQAEAVTLRWLEGLSLAETAARLGRSEPAVKALVARGLEALAGSLGRRGDFARPAGSSTP